MRIVYFHIFRRNVSISFLRGHVFEDFAWSRPDIEQKRKWNLCAHGNCRQELRVSSYGIFSAYFPLRFYYLQRYGRIRTSIHVFRVTKLAATIYLRVGECTELFSSGLSKTWENKEMSNKQTNKQTNRQADWKPCGQVGGPPTSLTLSQTRRQTDRQTDRQSDSQAETQTDRQTYR